MYRHKNETSGKNTACAHQPKSKSRLKLPHINAGLIFLSGKSKRICFQQLQQYCEKVVITMVKPVLTLFQM